MYVHITFTQDKRNLGIFGLIDSMYNFISLALYVVWEYMVCTGQRQGESMRRAKKGNSVHIWKEEKLQDIDWINHFHKVFSKMLSSWNPLENFSGNPSTEILSTDYSTQYVSVISKL